MAIVRGRRRRRRRKNAGAKALPEARQRNTTPAKILTSASMSYFLKGGYSCFAELGVMSWGARRADMVAVNLRQQIVICEIKSSVQDYATDRKWREYLPHCNRFYFVFSQRTYDSLKDRLVSDLAGTPAGVMVLSPVSGLLHVVRPAKVQDMDASATYAIITRMAWRGGVSKRTNRRTRHYINPDTENPNDTPVTTERPGGFGCEVCQDQERTESQARQAGSTSGSEEVQAFAQAAEVRGCEYRIADWPSASGHPSRGSVPEAVWR